MSGVRLLTPSAVGVGGRIAFRFASRNFGTTVVSGREAFDRYVHNLRALLDA